MNSLTPKELIEKLNWRYAVKKFDNTKKIPVDVWNSLEESLVLTPSSYGLQPWRFLVIEDLTLKQKLMPHTWNQTQVVDCSHYVVFACKKKMDEAHIQKFIARTAELRNMPEANLAGYKKMMIGDLVEGQRASEITSWAARQAYIALGNFMTSAALLGVDTCPIEGLIPAQYDEVLGLDKDGYATVCACAAGYRSSEDKYAKAQKVRFPKEDVIKKF